VRRYAHGTHAQEGGGMKTRFLFENPDEVQCTLKITMSMKEWCDLRDQLATKWPSARLSSHITDILSKARAVYYAEGTL